MTGHDPDSCAPAGEPSYLGQLLTHSDRTNETTGLAALLETPPLAPDAPRLGGGLALIVAFLGLLGAALGAAWIGFDARLGISPGGILGGGLVLMAAALLVVGLLLLIGGLGYYVLAPAFAGPKVAWRGVGSHRLVIATTLLIVLLANIGPIAFMALVGVQELRTIFGLLTSGLSVDVVLLGITYVRFIRPGILTAADLGLSRARFAHHVGIGLLVGVGVLVVSAVVQATLQAIGVRQTQLEGIQFVRDAPLPGFLAIVLVAGVLAPMAEELYFRGYVFRTYLLPRGPQTQRQPGENLGRFLLRKLITARGPWVAYSLTSVLFATLHLNGAAWLPILVLSLILCFAYRRTGSIIPSIVGHALNNTAAFCILYFTNAPL